MYLDTDEKKEIFAKHSPDKTAKDTGSSESQIALFTARITHLTQHLKINKHDYHSRVGLMRLVGKRRKMLDYLQRKDINRYRAIIAELGIRK
jgi:small subunit ribosomal protein S15